MNLTFEGDYFPENEDGEIKDNKSWNSMTNSLTIFSDAKTSFANAWLNNNYEMCEGVSVARCVLYQHYIQSCNQMGYEAINSASFGKIIRNVFRFLKTRRLGTRGNSRYFIYSSLIFINIFY